MCQLRVTFLYEQQGIQNKKHTHTFRHGRTNGKKHKGDDDDASVLDSNPGKIFRFDAMRNDPYIIFQFFFCSLLSCIVIHNTAVPDSYSAFYSCTFFALSLPFFFVLSLGPYFPCICCCRCRCRYCWLISLQSVRNYS